MVSLPLLPHRPLQHWPLPVQRLPVGRHVLPAAALFASPKPASAIPARPTPNFFSACRRVVDWANPLASSSNLLFILFLSICCFAVLLSVKREPPSVLAKVDCSWEHRGQVIDKAVGFGAAQAGGQIIA